MSKYQVRLGENVTDKIVNCGAGVYWYIDKLQSEIERLNNIINTIQQEMENLNNTGIFSIKPKYVWQRIETLKEVDKE